MKADAARILVSEPSEEAPECQPWRECWRVHPGICRTRHEGLCETALQIAQNLKQVFSRTRRVELLGQYLRIDGHRAGQHETVFLCIADFRRARPAVLLFATCEGVEHPSGFKMTLKLGTGRLEFLSSFELGLHFAGMEEVSLTRLKAPREGWLLHRGKIHQVSASEMGIKSKTGQLPIGW